MYFFCAIQASPPIVTPLFHFSCCLPLEMRKKLYEATANNISVAGKT